MNWYTSHTIGTHLDMHRYSLIHLGMLPYEAICLNTEWYQFQPKFHTDFLLIQNGMPHTEWYNKP